MFLLRIPCELALQFQCDASEQYRADRTMRGFDVANGAFSRAHTLQEIPRMAFAPVKRLYFPIQRTFQDLRRLSNQVLAVHGNPAFGSNEPRSPARTDRASWKLRCVNDNP